MYAMQPADAAEEGNKFMVPSGREECKEADCVNGDAARLYPWYEIQILIE